MTNQMRKFLQASMILSWVGLIFCVVGIIYDGIGYNNVFSYVLLGVNIVLAIFLTVFYIKAEADARRYKRQIFYAKKLLELREDAILAFYKRYGIQPLYKNGKLITPDELLQIATKLDGEGKLDPSIYEVLGIDPVLDSEGKEIPIVLVLKHLIKKVKKEGLLELSKKFKGFFLKGSKKEKKQEVKKTPNKKAEKEKGKAKKKKEKKLKGEDAKIKEAKKDKGKKNKSGEKPASNEEKKDNNPLEKNPEPKIVKLTPEDKIKAAAQKPQEKIETISNLFTKPSEKTNSNNNVKLNVDAGHDYSGEFTPE